MVGAWLKSWANLGCQIWTEFALHQASNFGPISAFQTVAIMSVQGPTQAQSYNGRSWQRRAHSGPEKFCPHIPKFRPKLILIRAYCYPNYIWSRAVIWFWASYLFGNAGSSTPIDSTPASSRSQSYVDEAGFHYRSVPGSIVNFSVDSSRKIILKLENITYTFTNSHYLYHNIGLPKWRTKQHYHYLEYTSKFHFCNLLIE